ncbi:hypothetical protein LTR28_005114 [Elasticomyces elasticus]|nr:hypothetical protein LTR28_005114 [Elasticomyces elasticus]
MPPTNPTISSSRVPPLPPLSEGSRVVVYHQTHHTHDGKPISVLPLITHQTGVTHVIVAAIHINEGPGNITLNDDPPDAKKFDVLWSEVAWLQASGVRVLGMLGGAAKGSFEKLDGEDVARFEAYYGPLATLIRSRSLSGLDLDVEEEMSLPGIIRLISRLRQDFGPTFLITLAPVATALIPSQPHLSGFSYHLLEAFQGHNIAWYNTQFYCGWGDASTTAWYDTIVASGWPAEKVVMGLVTHPGNGAGHVEWRVVEDVLRVLRARYPAFGGVMGWEYFNSLPGDVARPWQWAADMARTIRAAPPPPGRVDAGRGVERSAPGQLPLTPSAPPPVSGQVLPFPAHDVETLQGLGFSRQQAVAALNMTGGNLEYAAGLLFRD